MNRRNFALTAAGAGFATANAVKAASAPKITPWSPGIKMAVQLGADPSDEDLQFMNQIGVRYAAVTIHRKDDNVDNMRRIKAKVESAGLRVWNIGHDGNRNQEEIVLNLPGRDERIEAYKRYLQNCGKAGIRYVTYAHMGNGIWHTARETTRGNASARGFNLALGGEGLWAGKIFKGPLSHGRVFTENELWDNYEYFIRKVAPVAVENNVFIGIHPDDPPVPMLAGVPRCIFGNFEGYKRALEIANSTHVGVCFCVGTWLEGGDLMGADVVTAIKYFGERGKIWKVHFRNMSAPLPHFVETFVDNGYYDMYAAMKALREVNFDGIVIGDHFPTMVGGPRVAVAYTVAWIRSMIDRANAEVR
jgi:mannonate dehydratase